MDSGRGRLACAGDGDRVVLKRYKMRHVMRYTITNVILD